MTSRELQEFCRLFNEEKFFEAHEVLELLWRKTSDQNRDFYHGLIQIAAAFVHIQKSTPQGAHELFQKASVYLQKYPAVYENFPLQKLMQETKKFLNQTKSGRTAFPKIQFKL
ncbi:MAG: DUF309 domain-containing protein [Candidatus Omnitrophica bacterium]|nr:DUF309 domain-containing protein [Candidatus Omnitrophota bacterium]